jgi:hypothetical protein
MVNQISAEKTPPKVRRYTETRVEAYRSKSLGRPKRDLQTKLTASGGRRLIDVD